ncbi:hypothetical protein QFZ82_007485 [Streptomyces sp. V4I23]|nr:hypothetical protein [Streptomyces sp. V4I23]
MTDPIAADDDDVRNVILIGSGPSGTPPPSTPPASG